MGSYKLNEARMFCDIADNTAIIINSETGIYYGMNSLGTNVLENILKGVSTDKILSALKALDGVPESLEENFNMYINALIEKEVLLETDPSDAPAKIDAEIAKEDGFFVDVREYNDAQELLLADPIHEVKEETGWNPDKDSLNPDKEDVARRESKME